MRHPASVVFRFSPSRDLKMESWMGASSSVSFLWCVHQEGGWDPPFQSRRNEAQRSRIKGRSGVGGRFQRPLMGGRGEIISTLILLSTEMVPASCPAARSVLATLSERRRRTGAASFSVRASFESVVEFPIPFARAGRDSTGRHIDRVGIFPRRRP